MKKSLRVVAMVTALGLSPVAGAIPFLESGDAGQSLATALAVSGGTTSIQGALGSSDADMYRFTWGGGAFTAFTLGSALSDPQLFLFSAAGNLLLGNDDADGLQSRVSGALLAGDYFLAISSFNNDPMNALDQDMCNGNCGDIATASGPLDHWNGGGGMGTYTITLNAATTSGASVPLPGTLALLGIGLAGLGISRRRPA